MTRSCTSLSSSTRHAHAYRLIEAERFGHPRDRDSGQGRSNLEKKVKVCRVSRGVCEKSDSKDVSMSHSYSVRGRGVLSHLTSSV